MKNLTTIILATKVQDFQTPIYSPTIIGHTFPATYQHRSNVTFISLESSSNRALLKNQLIDLVKTDWILSLEPNETILSGLDKLKTVLQQTPDIYSLQTINNDVLTKNIKLWHKDKKLSYINPVFETIYADSKVLDVYFDSPANNDCDLNVLLQWQQANPLDNNPYYYLSCYYLLNKNWLKFIETANKFIALNNKPEMSVILTKYYLAQVQLYLYQDAPAAIRNVLPCIGVNPTMAEFWCLLGDIMYFKKQYQKALVMFRNAMILGKSRLRLDKWPIEINKYHKYPQKMVENCLKLINQV